MAPITGKIVLFGAIVFGLSGCATKKINPQYSEEQIKAFKQMAVVEPVLNLWELGSGSQSQATELENPTRNHIRTQLSDFVKRTDSRFYPIDGMSAPEKDSLIATFDSAFFRNEIDVVRIPENLLRIGGEERILFLYFSGSYKTKQRQRREFWKSIGIGVATLGMVVPLYYPGSAELYSVLIDKQKKRVVYTDRVVHLDDFRNEKSMNKLLEKSISKFYAVK